MNIQSAGEAVFLACEMEKQAVRLYERALMIFPDENMQQAVREILAEEKLAVLLRHARMLSELKGESVAVREMRRHIVCYVRGMRDAAKVRTKVNTILTLEELEEVLTAFMLKTE